ncbi:CRAL/TRIO domain-containing protein [Pseudovirgaria hyperparasitica]|uniref:CRAL/TRIO domain-containing protein n=1 Tax=Pseudovirgaria hyperparasitica TaxID=470096 RepID=A0A6A6WKF5_9PEZI|nr:CRAL/TRIO domain-containing protein [Pseudovirgaria hyperparasitica]KAF2762636.1 CRAL/TRIO domain-containing protein [Pseudovirgaria hyperparasitica]
MATTTEPQAVPATDTLLNEKVASLTVSDDATPAGSSDNSEKTSEVAPGPAVVAPELSSKPVATETPKDDEVFKLPIAHPLDTCKPGSPPEPTAEQQKKYDTVLAAVEAWTEIPDTAKGTSKAPLTDEERMWLTRNCLLRYLRATKWAPNEAITRLQATLTWRREFGIYDKITAEHTAPENETGKQVIIGYDINGRPCLYQDPSKQNTQESERQVHHLVYLLERAIDIMPPGQETLALVINFANSSRKTSPSMAMSRNVLNILQTYYPERLGRALISQLPMIISMFFKVITPFIDPLTREKIRFNEPYTSNIPPSQLLKSWGGEANFEYEHDVYWPALDAFAKQRKEAFRERWIARGKKIGDDEWILKGGSPQ